MDETCFAFLIPQCYLKTNKQANKYTHAFIYIYPEYSNQFLPKRRLVLAIQMIKTAILVEVTIEANEESLVIVLQHGDNDVTCKQSIIKK